MGKMQMAEQDFVTITGRTIRKGTAFEIKSIGTEIVEFYIDNIEMATSRIVYEAAILPTDTDG